MRKLCLLLIYLAAFTAHADTRRALMDVNGNCIEIGGAPLTLVETREQITINEGQTAVGRIDPGGSIVGGADAASFEVTVTGLVMTSSSLAPLADDTYEVNVQDGAETRNWEVIVLPSGGAFIPSKAAKDITADLARPITDHITPASYASWVAFLAAEAPLTGKVFGFAEGDYNWGPLDISGTTHGDGTEGERVVFKYEGDNEAELPEDRPADQALFHDHFYFVTAKHFLFHGLKIDASANNDQNLVGCNPHATIQCEDIIFDGMWLYESYQNGIYLRNTIDCGAQFCRVERVTRTLAGDALGIGVSAGDFITTQNNLRPWVVGCTILNHSDGIQWVDEPQVVGLGTTWIEDGLIYDNEVAETPEYLALLDPTDQSENALDIKVGGSSVDHPTFIRGNHLHGYYPTPSWYLSSGATSALAVPS